MSWWGPLAIVGGALGGAVIGYLLLVWTRPRRPPRELGAGGSLRFEPADATSDLKWNPAAFLVAGGAVALVVGLSVWLSLD